MAVTVNVSGIMSTPRDRYTAARYATSSSTAPPRCGSPPARRAGPWPTNRCRTRAARTAPATASGSCLLLGDGLSEPRSATDRRWAVVGRDTVNDQIRLRIRHDQSRDLVRLAEHTAVDVPAGWDRVVQLADRLPGHLPAMADVRNDRLRPEEHAVVPFAHRGRVELLAHVGHVVGQAQEVLLELVRPELAGYRQLPWLVGVAERAAALDHQQVLVGDPVDEDDPTLDLEVVGGLGQVVRRGVGGAAAAAQGEQCQHESGSQQKLPHCSPSLSGCVQPPSG